MQRRETEGSKDGMSKHVRPDQLDPTKRATRTDVESLAGDRNLSHSGGREKGGG